MAIIMTGAGKTVDIMLYHNQTPAINNVMIWWSLIRKFPDFIISHLMLRASAGFQQQTHTSRSYYVRQFSTVKNFPCR
jgi:hypothetical protein